MSAYVQIPEHVPPYVAGLMIGVLSTLRNAGREDQAETMAEAACALYPPAAAYLPKKVDIDVRPATLTANSASLGTRPPARADERSTVRIPGGDRPVQAGPSSL